MTEAQHRITEIFRTLELEVQDREILRQEGRIDLLLDTVDFENALLGYYEYVVPKKRPLRLKSTFEEPAALASFLVASGWLGAFRMLPPHQTEFLRHLDSRAAFQDARGPIPLELRDEFLRAVGLLDAEPTGQPSIKGLRGENLLLIFKKHAEKAERSFKAVQAILYSWGMRLRKWKQDRLFGPCGYQFDYPRLVNSGLFARIFTEFQNVPNRDQHTVNNFADAVALMMLIELCHRARIDFKANAIPRFFDSTGTFQHVARAAGIEDDLTVVVPTIGPTRVLVTADYLIYKASFRKPFMNFKEESQAEEDQLQPEEIFAEIKRILGEDEDRKLSALETVEIRGRKLGDVINDFVHFSFLKNVWLEQVAGKDLEEVAHQLELGVEEVSELEAGAKEVIELTTQELRERADTYELLSELWLELRAGVENLRKSWKRRTEANAALDLDVIRDLDLVRFCLPARIEARLRPIAEGLLRHDLEAEDFTTFKQWEELVDLYLDAAVSPLDHSDDAQVAAAFLWSMRKFKSIIRLLRDLAGRSTDFSLDILFAASCFRRNKRIPEARSILARLTLCLTHIEKELEEGVNRELLRSGVELSIGIAYLRFHYWQSRDYAVEWRNESPEIKHPLDDEGRQLILGAEVGARSALRLIKEYERRYGLDEDMNMKQVYALNQKLYYMTETGAEAPGEMSEIVATSSALLSYKPNSPDLWLPTYHDTLARCFHLLAIRSTNEEHRAELLKEALYHCAEAIRGDPDEVLFRQYRGQLLGALPIGGFKQEALDSGATGGAK